MLFSWTTCGSVPLCLKGLPLSVTQMVSSTSHHLSPALLFPLTDLFMYIGDYLGGTKKKLTETVRIPIFV